jgi:plasmid maintenance system killer protein
MVRRTTVSWRKTGLFASSGCEPRVDLKDLSIPSSNQLEALKGDQEGEYSIRINKQWRICFRWRDGHAFDVEIVDYH